MKNRPAPCGTNGAYQRHLRRRETPCDACRAAHTTFIGAQRQDRDRPPRQPARCGTDSGYSRHHRRHEPVCDPCREAHAQALRDWRQTRRARAAAFDDALAEAVAELTGGRDA